MSSSRSRVSENFQYLRWRDSSLEGFGFSSFDKGTYLARCFRGFKIGD